MYMYNINKLDNFLELSFNNFYVLNICLVIFIYYNFYFIPYLSNNFIILFLNPFFNLLILLLIFYISHYNIILGIAISISLCRSITIANHKLYLSNINGI